MQRELEYTALLPFVRDISHLHFSTLLLVQQICFFMIMKL